MFPNKRALQPIVASMPMERAQVDLVDLSSVAFEKHRYVLVMIDVHSRFLWLRPMKTKSAQTVADLLNAIWMDFGTPRYVQTDNGTEFIGQPVKDLLKSLNIKHITGRPRHPQSQGKVNDPSLSMSGLQKTCYVIHYYRFLDRTNHGPPIFEIYIQEPFHDFFTFINHFMTFSLRNCFS